MAHMARRKKVATIHTHGEIVAVKGKCLVSFGVPLGGVVGVALVPEIPSDGSEATLNDITLDDWPSPVSPVSACVTLIFQ